MIKWIFCCLLSLSVGCASHPPNKKINRPIAGFNNLSYDVGNMVILDGFLSSTHEAQGIYLKRADLKRLNSQCVALSPSMLGEHGSRVRVIGKLTVSECASERICVTACGRYKLVRP